MSTRAALATRVRENLDDLDSSNYRWVDDRLSRILEAKRRDIYHLIRGLAPGRYFRSTQTVTTVVNQVEYTLSASGTSDLFEVVKVERIAVNGSPLVYPVDLVQLTYSDKNRFNLYPYNYPTSLIYQLREMYYVSLQASGGMVIGIVPTPQTAGADLRVTVDSAPNNNWSAGSGQDSVDSQLPPRWEDLLVIQATIAALRQRPPRDTNTLISWQKEAEALQEILVKAETFMTVDTPRQVRMEDGGWDS